ncbi:DUF1403 family protein [Shinella lacus]|uniref:DUF1403 family protein n=1 Tax=Shinella lacus TaxID=2654216 RepID=UPI003F709058
MPRSPTWSDSANQSGRAAPFAVADLITAISAVRPDAEVIALGLAEAVLADKPRDFGAGGGKRLQHRSADR